MLWKLPAADAVALRSTYKLAGKPPFERLAPEISLQGNGWLPLQTPRKAEHADQAWSPVTIELEINEHRSATVFAAALQKALADNEADIRQAVRDGYPWRRREVQEAAQEQALKTAREKLESYLDGLDGFIAECSGALDSTKQTRCGIGYVKLLAAYEAAYRFARA